LEKSREESEWMRLERDGDVKLKRKGKYGMDSRTVWFVVESKDEFDRLNALYPGRIKLCDRTFILDTQGKKPMPKSTQLHEIRQYHQGFHELGL
jgi:hypothetical protein